MPSKVQAYAQMADHAAAQLTGSRQSWTEFLTTAARLYKYPYHEQLMIYAQRPDATACAEYEFWNDKMRRYVRRGSKGIALIDASGDRPRLKYVFDVSDTGGGENSRRPFLWDLRQEHEAPVTAMLEREYEVSGADGLAEQLQQIAAQMADEYWTENSRDILYNIDDSFLEDYDEFNAGVAFREAATVSISYMLMKRCGIDPDEYFEHEDYLSIFDFNTPAAVAALGTATSRISQQVLRQIEVTVKNYEREHFAERSVTHGEQPDLQPERGLSDSRPDDDGADGEHRQIRAHEEELPQGASPGVIQFPAAVGEAVSPSVGDRPNSEPADRPDDAGADEIGGRDREPESRRPDALGGTDEQPESPGRGNDTGGAYLQLSLFPTEQEQVQRIAESEQPSAFSMPPVPEQPAISEQERRDITQADIDAALQEWNGDIKSKHTVVRHMEKHARDKDTAAFLRAEYGDDLPAFPVTADGAATDVPWPKVQRRIAQLIAADKFYTQAEYDNLDDVDPLAIRERLEQAGIVNGEVVDPAALDSDPFIRQVTADAEHMAQREEPEAQGSPIAPPAPQPPYSVGDTVYLENDRPFVIEHIGDFNVRLQDPSLAYPISRAESIESFERLLQRNPKNRAFTDFLAARLESVQPDILDVISNGLLSPEQKGMVSAMLTGGASNYDLAASLSETYPYDPQTMTMTDGTVADFFPQQGGLYIELQDKFSTKLSATWGEIAPILRTLSARGWEPEPERSAAPVLETPAPQAPRQTAENFRITDDTLGAGGAKSKFHANIEAIRTLQTIEAEGRAATPEEQEILSRYVGWGGLADAFDDSKPAWTNEYKELQSLLSPEEYASARASTLNAHYTSPTVIRAIYEVVGGMGYRTGNILEPACGVGNFFGCLPEEMHGSKLYGVELDGITGRIAGQLYPEADITVAGFETTDRRDFYDIAVGNVPFGQYQVNDRAYNKLGFSIHDYFFAKTLDQVRPGGVIAFVTSRYTMDKQSPEVRRYIAKRAELLGAIRLPNNAFKANAGTEVVSDILFLQKRDRPIEIEPDWVHLGSNEDGFAINSYFIDHPEMVLGTPTSESTQYGRQDYTVAPIPGADLANQLREAVAHISGQYNEAELPDLGEGETIDTSIPADPNVKNYSYTVVDGEVYYRENSRMVRPGLNDTAMERVRGMVELRDCVHQLIDLQMDEFTPDAAIREKQAELNRLYDAFSAKYDRISSRGNKLAFSDDSSYYLLCSLEVLDDDGNFERKADMFTKRTIRQQRSVTSVDTAAEALAVSIGERATVDLPFMAQLTGMSEEQVISDLSGVIFKDPTYGDDPLTGWQTADEYLSGNVRRKLREARRAAERDPAFQINVEALEKAQPKDLDASEIEVRLGATWIDKGYIQQFMEETFNTPRYLRGTIEVKYVAYTAEWQISNKTRVPYSDVAAYTTYGTDRANAYRILEDSLNLRDIRIYDTVEDADGKERRVLNSTETTLAAQKQQAIRDAFRDWIWRDPERRQALVKQYNEEMNSTRPREYDGRHLTFSGMNPEIALREHQLNAIAHILYGGNTLLAHEVGAGKTFEMVAACMEGKRLGLCQKSIFVVPNHLTEQWASEFLRLYPSANLLVTTKKDFETHNRKKFCARIATGDYDAVVIGHSQFERVPISPERQKRLLQEQIWEITDGIAEVEESGGERFTVKQLERTKKSLEARLEKLLSDHRKDDVISFEQLGVDRMFVDESHNYKNRAKRCA